MSTDSTPVSPSGVATYEQRKVYTYVHNIQTPPPHNEAYRLLPSQPHTPPSPSYFLPSPTPYYSVYYTDHLAPMTAGPTPPSAMSPLVTDTHNYGFDAHNLPYAPPATPASTVTDSHSPVTPHSPLAFPLAPEHFFKAQSSPARSEERIRGRHRSGSRNSTDSRSCFYRTKPCRFFHSSGFCIKGDRCNFIHDYDAMGHNSSTGGGTHDDQPENHMNDENRRSRRSSQSKTDVKRVGKRVTSVTDNNRSNFYPITWRVIGGGVLMSGSRDVCQAFLAGRCNEGLDCRFSHPSISDDLDPSIVYVPSPSAEPYYPLADRWSPVSPPCIRPFTVSHMVPPSPITEDGDEDIAEKLPTTDTLVSRPTCRYLPTRVLLDGSTLSPHDLLCSDNLNDDDGSSHFDNSSSPESSLEDNIGARGIIRPVSTPPSTSPTTAKVVRLFAAEMP